MARKEKACWGPNLGLDEIATWQEGRNPRAIRHLSCRFGGWLVLDSPPSRRDVISATRAETLLQNHRLRCAHCFRFAGRQVRRYLVRQAQEQRVMLLVSSANPRSLEVNQPLLAPHYRSNGSVSRDEPNAPPLQAFRPVRMEIPSTPKPGQNELLEELRRLRYSDELDYAPKKTIIAYDTVSLASKPKKEKIKDKLKQVWWWKKRS